MLFRSLLFALPSTINVGPRLKLLAISSQNRIAMMPNVSTVSEAGFPELTTALWQGVCAPRGIPRPALNRLTGELKRALERSDVRDSVIARHIKFPRSGASEGVHCETGGDINSRCDSPGRSAPPLVTRGKLVYM